MDSSDRNIEQKSLSESIDGAGVGGKYNPFARLSIVVAIVEFINIVLQLVITRLVFQGDKASSDALFIGLIISHVLLAAWQIGFTALAVIKKTMRKGKAALFLVLGSALYLVIYNIAIGIGELGTSISLFDGHQSMYAAVLLYEVIITVLTFPIFLIALIVLLSQKDTAIESFNKLLDFDADENIIKVEEALGEDSFGDSLLRGEINNKTEENPWNQSAIARNKNKATVNKTCKELPAALPTIFITVISLCALYMDLGGNGYTQIILWVFPAASILLGALALLSRNTIISKALIFALCFIALYSAIVCGLHVIKSYNPMIYYRITFHGWNIVIDLIIYIASLMIYSAMTSKKMPRNNINEKIVLILSAIPIAVALIYVTQVNGCREVVKEYQATWHLREITIDGADREYKERVVICRDLLN